MKKMFVFLFLLTALVFALDDATIPNIFSANTPARAAEVNENFDSLETSHNKLIDSLGVFTRDADFDSADTNLEKFYFESTFVDYNRTSICSTYNLTVDSIEINNGSASFEVCSSNYVYSDSIDIVGGNASFTSCTSSYFITDDIDILSGNASFTSCTSSYFITDDIDILSGNASFTNCTTSFVTSDTIITRLLSVTDTIFASKSVIDTLSVTDSLFSAQIIATTVDINGGSLDGVTIGGSVEGAGYFDTLSSSKGITCTALNTGNGLNELYAMDQDVKTTDSVEFARITGDSIFATILEATNTNFGSISVDSLGLRVVVGDSANFGVINTGHGQNELYAMNQDVETTDAVTFSTVNTGQGDNELYDMDQNVLTTSNVIFNSANVKTIGISSSSVKIPLQVSDYCGIEAAASGSFFKSNNYYDLGNKALASGYAARADFDIANGGIYFKTTALSYSADDVLTDLTNKLGISKNGDLYTIELSSGATPSSGYGNWYCKTNGLPYFKNDAGTEYSLGYTSGDFTGTLTGLTTSPTGSFHYTILDSIVTLYIPYISGTSNSDSCTITGIPSAIQAKTSTTISGSGIRITDATAGTIAGNYIIEDDGRIIVCAGNVFTLLSWANSGARAIGISTITYRLNR